MSVEENKELIRKVFVELDEAGADIARIRSSAEKNVAQGYVFHHLSLGDMSIERQIELIASSASALSGISGDVDDQIAEGDKVVTRYTMRGTNRATGKQIANKGVLIDKIIKGKIVEEWQFP